MQTNISLPPGIDAYVDAPLEFFDLLDDSIPTEVCHYTSKETAMEHILESKKIRLGRLGFTNDPRESKRWMVPNVVWGEELIKEGEKELARSTLMIEYETKSRRFGNCLYISTQDSQRLQGIFETIRRHFTSFLSLESDDTRGCRVYG